MLFHNQDQNSDLRLNSNHDKPLGNGIRSGIDGLLQYGESLKADGNGTNVPMQFENSN